jgi:hypothetical protein
MAGLLVALQRELKRLKARTSGGGIGSAEGGSGTAAVAQPASAHAWSDLGFGSTEQRETLAALELCVEQLVSHIVTHLDHLNMPLGKQWMTGLQTYLQVSSLKQLVKSLPGGTTELQYLLHDCVLRLLMECSYQVLQKSDKVWQNPLSRKFSAPGAQVMVESGEQHWKQAQHRAWFMTGTLKPVV